MLEFLQYAVPAVILGGGLLYFVKVWLPSALDSKEEVDLEEVRKEVLAHKKEVAGYKLEVGEKAAATEKAVVALHEESTQDKVQTATKTQAVNKNASSIKEYLVAEGFNVEEINPE